MNPVGRIFEESFLTVPLERQIEHCDHYELAPLFREWLPSHQPILEAGCGSGRWVAWFVRQGWQATGLDWSESLCARARQEIPGASFHCGDMRRMPFPGDSFGAVVSLGAIEHTPEGPMGSLDEYCRVLKADGVAIITVPFLGPVRQIRRGLARLYRLAEKRSVPSGEVLPVSTPREWAADYILHADQRTFFQYNFTRAQMRGFLSRAGLEIVREFVEFRSEGVLHNFGRRAGSYDFWNGHVVFSPLGRLFRALFPLQWVGHMLCYVARRP